MEHFLGFLITSFLFAVCLWISMKITSVFGSFFGMFTIAAITSSLQLIPKIGIFIAPIGMYYLICKWTDAKFWPDAVLMVIVSNVIAFFLGAIILDAIL